MTKISEVKEGDLVEILLDDNASFLSIGGVNSFIQASEDEESVRGVSICGYVSKPLEKTNGNYLSLYPSWDKEGNKPAIFFGFTGFRVYSNVVKSISIK